MSESLSHPRILGENLYQNPLGAPDGTIESAFGALADEGEGPTYGIPRIREQIWGDRLVPDNIAEIETEINVIHAIRKSTESKSKQRMSDYENKLFNAFNARSASAILLTFAVHFPAIFASSQDDEPEIAELKDHYIETAALLCGPLAEEDGIAIAREKVIPPLEGSFADYYQFIGVFMGFQAAHSGLNPQIRDQEMEKRLDYVAKAYGEYMADLSPDQFVEWAHGLGTETIRSFADAFELSKKSPVAKRAYVVNREIFRQSAMPVIDYFSNNQGKIDFQKVKDVTRVFKARARRDNPVDYKSSQYWGAAKRARGIVCSWHKEQEGSNWVNVMVARATSLAATGSDKVHDPMLEVHIEEDAGLEVLRNPIKKHTITATIGEHGFKFNPLLQ